MGRNVSSEIEKQSRFGVKALKILSKIKFERFEARGLWLSSFIGGLERNINVNNKSVELREKKNTLESEICACYTVNWNFFFALIVQLWRISL